MANPTPPTDPTPEAPKAAKVAKVAVVLLTSSHGFAVGAEIEVTKAKAKSLVDRHLARYAE